MMSWKYSTAFIGPLWRESFQDRWIPATKSQWCGALHDIYLLASANCWTNSPIAGDLRCHDTHLMSKCTSLYISCNITKVLLVYHEVCNASIVWKKNSWMGVLTMPGIKWHARMWFINDCCENMSWNTMAKRGTWAALHVQNAAKGLMWFQKPSRFVTQYSVVFNSLWCSDVVWRQIWVSIGSGNGLVSDGTKSLPEPMLTYHQ